jgi:putative intracellular protease/amidase
MSATAPADSTATFESGQNLPQKWGVILFPGFDQLDVAGPMEYLNALALQYPTTLSIVAKSLDPVSTKIPKSFVPGDLPGIEQRWVPTHTFEDVPPLDVLLIPGGYGTFIEDIQQEVGDFIKKTYPVRISFALA